MQRPRHRIHARWTSAGGLALLWAATALLGVVDVVVSRQGYALTVVATVFLSGICVLGGLGAAWLLRLKGATVRLLAQLMMLELVASGVTIIMKLVTPAAWYIPMNWTLVGLYVLTVSVLIYRGYGAGRSRARRVGAIALVIGVNLVAAALVTLDGTFWLLSEKVQPLLGRQSAANTPDEPPADIAQDRLWEAQPGLLAAQREALRPAVSGRTNIYAIAVAASGTQALFAREALEALRATRAHFGQDSRGGVLLSNGAVDLLRSPLATRGNIAAAAEAIGAVADPKRDVVFLYLASHGSPTAELASDLPSYQSVQAISAASTAAALRKARLARRIVVVSACYAGTWIPALADDNTVIITASATDRTSFGCDDSRRLTVFGEAFLENLATPDLSLRDAFERAKRKIADAERAEGLTPSLPQVYVGRNMMSLWTTSGATAPTT